MLLSASCLPPCTPGAALPAPLVWRRSRAGASIICIDEEDDSEPSTPASAFADVDDARGASAAALSAACALGRGSEADVALAQMLPCSVGERWARIETVRIEAKRSPVCWSDIYVPAEFAAVAERIGKDSTPVFQLMEQTYGTLAADINAELFAGSLSQRKAEALEVAPGSAALIIVRRYRDINGRLFEVSVSEHPAGRFSYSIDLKRKQGSMASS